MNINSTENLIITSNGKKYKKPKQTNIIGGILAANTAGLATYHSIIKLSQIPINKTSKLLSSTDNDIFRQAADKAFSNSGLEEKGVKILEITEKTYKNAIQDMQKEIPKWIKMNPLAEKLYNKQITQKAHTVLIGRNAFYNFTNSNIMINKDKMSWAAFHEMGHAMNHKVFGISKLLIILRSPMSYLTPLVILTAMIKRKKADGEKPQGFFDKATTFAKENAGKLAFVGMLPILLEEGLASIKGAKLAKNVLSKENLKKINKQNLAAFTTYIGMAIAASTSAYIISKIKDAIASPKEIKE